MLASSSSARVQSLPGRAPITTGEVFEIEPTFAACENVCPSATSLIVVAVFTHWIVCHRPSFSAGPAMISLYPAEPSNPQDAWPDCWNSILYSPPAVV